MFPYIPKFVNFTTKKTSINLAKFFRTVFYLTSPEDNHLSANLTLETLRPLGAS